jgi:hypothetical protein
MRNLRILSFCYVFLVMQETEAMSIYKRMLRFKTQEQPDLVISDKNHLSMFAAIAIMLEGAEQVWQQSSCIVSILVSE